MKDDPSTPTTEGLSPNEFVRDKPGTRGRARAQSAIDDLRKRGGIFVEAVRATRMPMALTDPNLPGNPIVFANEAFVKLSGYRMDEVLGQQPHFMNGPGTDPSDVARFEEAIRSDQDDIIETVQYRKNGSRFVATVLVSAFKDDQGRTLNHFMSWLDVTRRVDAEVAMRKSEQENRSLFETMSQGYSEIELIRDGEGRVVNHRYLALNPAYERLTGLAVAEAIGRTAREILPDLEPFWAETYDRIARKGEFERLEHQVASLNRWYEVFVHPRGGDRLSVLYEDITERKRAEFALRESEERQAFLLALEDRLRPLTDASDIMTAATNFLGMHLDADRAMYAEVEGDRGSEVGNIRGQYIRTVGSGEDDIFSFPDQFTYETYGESTMEARYRGEALVVSDIACDPNFSHSERSAWLDVGVSAAVVATLAKNGRLVAELGVQSKLPREWTSLEVSLIRDVAQRTWDAVERGRAETALRSSEEKYRALFESMDEAYAVVEVLKDEAGRWVDFRFLDANPTFLEHTSMPYPVGKTATELIGTPNPRWIELYGQALDTGKPIRIEEEEPALGRTFDLNIFSLDRDQNRVAILFTNITERKAADKALNDSERHAQVLLGELQHRVRNTLAVVRSIARRTAERTESSTDFMSHFEGRLNAFSRVQAGVTRSATGTVELKGLVEDELLALATREGAHLQIKGPEVGLTARAAESISLAVHELATNAVKYGALTVPDGRIRVSWRYAQDESGGDVLAFDWRESGLDAAPTATKEGFGHELLLRSLPYDLGAKTEITFEEDGLRFAMTLPVGPDVMRIQNSKKKTADSLAYVIPGRTRKTDKSLN